MDDHLTVDDLSECFIGRVPAVIATCDRRGLPNITYLTSVHRVDSERVALSNQFMSKTAQNLSENPRASLLVLHPQELREYRLDIRYERTERRGPVFERLRAEVDQVAAMTGMASVFRLRSADIYRVTSIEIISPDDLRVVAQNPGFTATLFACHPPGSIDERIVAHLSLAS